MPLCLSSGCRRETEPPQKICCLRRQDVAAVSRERLGGFLEFKIQKPRTSRNLLAYSAPSPRNLRIVVAEISPAHSRCARLAPGASIRIARRSAEPESRARFPAHLPTARAPARARAAPQFAAALGVRASCRGAARTAHRRMSASPDRPFPALLEKIDAALSNLSRRRLGAPR